jgi:type IV pilus assembly protein PilC
MLLTSAKEVREESQVQVKFLDRFMLVPLKEKMVFARNLAVMVSSGLVVVRAIKSLSIQTKNKTFKKILDDVHDEVQAGKTLSEALAKYPTVFSELFVNMVYVGEVSGNLESVLDVLALQLEKEQDLKSKVKGAMTYPAVIVVAMVGIGVLMLTYILPKITGVFKDMDVELPKTTLFIMGMSDFLREHAILSVAIVVFLLVGTKLFYGTVSGKRFFHFLFLRMPIVGNIVVKVNCARFARIYSSLLKSGVSVVDSLKIVSRTLGNVYYKDVLAEATEEIQKGTNLSAVIGAHERQFPILVSQIIEVGEETGKTEVVLERLAEFYEEEVNQITKNMSSIIEPVLMLLIGGGVGFFAVAMLQPMYSVLENIQ